MAPATVEAIYQDGVLKPLQNLNISDNTHVWIQIIPVPSDQNQGEEERFKAQLLELGLLRDVRQRFEAPEEERIPIRVKGKPLSQTIVEERR